MEESKEWTLNKVVFYFDQEGNTCGTTKPTEELIIEVETPHGCLTDNDGGFIVLKTDGWSMNSEEELKPLIDSIRKGIKI